MKWFASFYEDNEVISKENKIGQNEIYSESN
jgi:hypothetical protein